MRHVGTDSYNPEGRASGEEVRGRHRDECNLSESPVELVVNNLDKI